MKFSERTLTVLKSFSTINKSILMRAGNTLKTITPEKTLVAIANIPDEIPSDACIYDLSRFLSIVSLYEDPDVAFHDKYFVISEGRRKTKYVFADVSMIHSPPDKDIKIPSRDIEIDVTWNDLQSVLKAASVLQFDEIALVSEDNKCYLRAVDSSNPTADNFGVEIGDTQDDFMVIFKTDNLKLIPGDYHITICSKGISEFKGEDVTYFVGIDTKSKFNKKG